MAVYKDGDKWRVIYRYMNWNGERKQTQKRGFATKREAQAWEHEAMLKQDANLDMTFESFFEIYKTDKIKRLKANTWESKEHIVRTKILPYFGWRKLSNLKGRIDYISNPKRQEHLYAVYDTADPLFWRELAKENMRIHKESGTKGKCIEGRELIIALPEPLTEKDPNELLRGIVEVFRKKYGVDCIAALHHNKRKTNYHIHLIFSERKRKEVINEKIATRNMFYDENGKHVRTKKEILDENGNIRDGCYIIKKGEVYERDIFSVKDKQFKSKAFLKEAKVYLMDHINTLLPEGYPKLTIFDDEEVYLPMLKIGKNNPKEAEIIAANELRTAWNQIADQAMVEGVPQADIKKIKQVEIMEAAKKSIKEHGKEPGRFNRILREAMQHLRKLILKIRDAVKSPEVVPEEPIHHKSDITPCYVLLSYVFW